MPMPNSDHAHETPATAAAQKARSTSGAAVETVAPKPRRRFSAADKLRFLKAADAAIASGVRGALGALLRKEGIYSSHLATWRAQLAAKGSDGLAPRKPGRKPKVDPADRELLALQKKNARLEHQLAVANALIELQKKAHALLGIALPTTPDDEES